MESTTISDLAKLLRNDGDQVLNAKCRLSLSAPILHALNEAFCLVAERDICNTTFQVISSNNTKAEIFRDLQFLHDFVQKTLSLCIASTLEDKNVSAKKYNIDVSKFRNLRTLEVHKIPILCVRGVQSLRAQLQSLTCNRCVDNIKDILSACGGDHSTGFVWSELKEAVFSYNNLESIDSSLEYLPWLQVLDLSHNRIVTAEALKWLPNLKYINLSYNKLDEIPMFHVESSRKLQSLKISNNDIESITGINRLESLNDVDLSHNYILDHSTLIPLSYLPNLRWLTLIGNPLSYHPQHRKLTAKYLHKNAGTIKFLLDNTKLTKAENSLTGSYKLTQRLQRSPRRHLNSVSSNQSYDTTASDSTCSDTKNLDSVVNTSLLQPRKTKKLRDAIIANHDDEDESEQTNSSMQESIVSIESMGNSNHLETKKQISDLREQFGDAWLHSHAGSLVQNVLGMQPTVNVLNQPILVETDALLESIGMTKSEKEFQQPLLSSTPKVDNHNEFSTGSPKDQTFYNSVVETSTEDFASISEEERLTDAETLAKENAMISHYGSILSNNMNMYADDNDNLSDHGSEEHTYIAHIQNSNGNKEVFVIVTDNKIKERCTLTARTLTYWSLSTLLSCERINSTTVILSFDTVRRDRDTRKYILDEEDAQKLDVHLRDILSSRPLQEMNQVVFRCMKCSMQFTKEIEQIVVSRLPNEKSSVRSCPSCHSKLVVEIEDEMEKEGNILTKTKSVITENAVNEPLPHEIIHSKSQSSIGSANSLEESITDSTVSIAGSDIEVLSNPSQSSIEVLHRKRSSEERRVLAYPSLDTIHDVIQTNNASKLRAKTQSLAASTLTESSSSGSMTNSVCTAIENYKKDGDLTPSNGTADLKNEKSVLSSSPSIISSMLEGLFQSANSLISKTSKQSEVKSDDLDSGFSYSYEDFSVVDHRLMFHLYQNIFSDVNETLKWLLRCDILFEYEKNSFPGCLVLSNTKFYIMKINGSECGDPSKWLIKHQSHQIHRLMTVNVLPYKQGISLGIDSSKPTNTHVLCLLKDLQRSNSFLAYLTDNKLPESCILDCVVQQSVTKRLHKIYQIEGKTSDDSPAHLQLFSIFSSYYVENQAKSEGNTGCIIITTQDIIICDCLLWLLPHIEVEPVIMAKQPLTNLVEVDVQEKCITFHYLDELQNSEESWKIGMETKNAVDNIIGAVRHPWEKLFLVPLTVNL